MIEALAVEGVTMILVTKAVLMHQGRIWEEGDPAQMFEQPQTPELRQFLGSGVK